MSRLPTRKISLAAVVLVFCSSAALGCLWDSDTIQMERARFPSTLELITGKFLRHSPEFYEWRIQNRLERLKPDPNNLALLDDLAVAYDKTGQQEKAIEIALRQEQLQPDRYETAANLGTFYFHAGKLKEGLPHIERALKINPDAHFGREKYQKLLGEYVLKVKCDKPGPLSLPTYLPTELVPHVHGKGFAAFLASTNGNEHLTNSEQAAAVKGILGIMKFGNHKSPLLLESLGFLLLQDESERANDAKLLAARAFLKASYEVESKESQEKYRRLATAAIFMQLSPPSKNTGQITIEIVEQDFRKELADANVWYEQLHEGEKRWIAEGKDPEAEFDKLYDKEPVALPTGPTNSEVFWIRYGGLVQCFSVVILFMFTWVAAVILFFRYRRKKRARFSS